MPTPRITPLEPPYSPAIQAEFDKIMRGAPPLLLFRTVARNPRALQRWFAGGLLDRGSISLRLRELVILRTTALCGAEYEWGVHVATFGGKAQWTPEQLRSTVHGTAADPCWTEEERIVIQLADQLHASATVHDEVWRRAAVAFWPEQLIELVMLAGSYRTVSYFVNALGVQQRGGGAQVPGGQLSLPCGTDTSCAAIYGRVAVVLQTLAVPCGTTAGMTWRNPQLTAAADEWRTAQSAVIQARRPIRVLDEECSSPKPPSRPGARDITLLEAQATRALSECLRLARQADRISRR